MDIQFLITTYNRQESCQRLVDSLQGLGDILVLNDGCDYEIKNCKQVFQTRHNGRNRYYATVNNLFSLRKRYPYYIMLPDDFLMDAKQVEKTVGLWRGLEDKKRICLNLYADRIGKKCWTGFQPRKIHKLWLTQWVDMCFLCENKFFMEVGHIAMDRYNPKSRKSSSGVGAYISRRLYQKGFNIYQVTESLVTPQAEHWLNSQIYDKDNITDCVYSFSASKFKRIY